MGGEVWNFSSGQAAVSGYLLQSLGVQILSRDVNKDRE